MTEIERNKRKIQEEFSEFVDGFERYSYLIEISGLLPAYPEEKRTDAYMVRGCQSHAWLDICEENGRFFFNADSDTRIVKGVLLIMQDLLNGVPVEEVAALEMDFMAEFGLVGEFSDARQKGLAAVMSTLKTAAQTMLSL